MNPFSAHVAVAALLASSAMAGQPPPDGFDAKDCVRGGAPPCGVDCSPVCGSDGVTYKNECWLKWTQVCGGGAGLTTVAPGACKAVDASWKPAKCDANSGSLQNHTDCSKITCPVSFSCETVCGSDGVGYADDCFFEAAKCLNASLVIVKGPCPPPKYTNCIKTGEGSGSTGGSTRGPSITKPDTAVTVPPAKTTSASTVSMWTPMTVAIGAIAVVVLELAL